MRRFVSAGEAFLRAPAERSATSYGAAHRIASTAFSSNTLAAGAPEAEVTPQSEKNDEPKERNTKFYRRRSSDPQTLRERMEFRRDHQFARYRPLRDVPWRQSKKKTYLDDAERFYGRKETWHTIEDSAVREKLVALLQDYLRDTTAAAVMEAKDASRYKKLCDSKAREYRSHLAAGAFGAPQLLRQWFVSAASPRTRSSDVAAKEGEDIAGAAPLEARHSASLSSMPAEHTSAATEGSSNLSREAEQREQRRQRGERATLENTVAIAGLPEADTKQQPLSGFPFLRARALDAEHTLDPSLVDWTAKYFADDDAKAFAHPPRVKQPPLHTSTENSPTHGYHHDEPQGESRDDNHNHTSRRTLRSHPRQRLQQSLNVHNDRHRATFDAEGIFYRVRRPSNEDDRAPKPQALRGSDELPTDGSAEVVKVPWSVVSTSKEQGYTADILRAKERLIRLSRGEDPESIP